MGKPITWFEITSAEPEKASAFYAELFDWQTSSPPELGGYTLVDTGNGDDAVGGGIGAPEAGNPPAITLYVKVDDLAATLAHAERLGGRTLVPPTPLPADNGSIAIMADLDGNALGLWA